MAQNQRTIAELSVKRASLEAHAQQLQNTRVLPGDPVEAMAAGRTAPTAKWLREHRDVVLSKGAKLTAAHHDALAEDLAPDSDAYFAHVEKFLGLRDNGDSVRRKNSSDADNTPREPKVTFIKRGQPVPEGTTVMSPGEYESATETIKWGYDDPNGKFKKNDPIGVREYLRRQEAMKNTPGWYDRPDGY
jgi:hypothetical protein